MKANIRDKLCSLYWKIGLSRPTFYALNKLTVVTFHRVLTNEQRNQYPLPGLVVTPEELDLLCYEFKKHFECSSLTSIYNKWSNDKNTDKPLLAITFDDGQLDNYVNAKPILAKHKINATFYISTHFIDTQTNIWHDRLGFAIHTCTKSKKKKDNLISLAHGIIDFKRKTGDLTIDILKNAEYHKNRERFILEAENLANKNIPPWAGMMSWDQIKDLKNSGHEIGSHTINHALLTQLDDDEVCFEVIESRKELELKLGDVVESFCYPNGDNDQRIQKIVSDAGYQNAVTTFWGLNSLGTKKHSINRCDMNAFRLVDRKNKISSKRLHFRLSCLPPNIRKAK